MTVRELLSRIGSDEITEWMAFYQLEPFGDFRSDLRSGIMAATFANAHRAAHAPPFTPENFMPFCTVPAESNAYGPTGSRENIARFKALFAHRVKKNG